MGIADRMGRRLPRVERLGCFGQSMIDRKAIPPDQASKTDGMVRDRRRTGRMPFIVQHRNIGLGKVPMQFRLGSAGDPHIQVGMLDQPRRPQGLGRQWSGRQAAQQSQSNGKTNDVLCNITPHGRTENEG
jgi:hypothetical protein